MDCIENLRVNLRGVSVREREEEETGRESVGSALWVRPSLSPFVLRLSARRLCPSVGQRPL